MDEVDRKLLTVLGKGVPIGSRPFKQIAEQISLDEGQVIERSRSLIERGHLTRIGAIIDPREIGFTSTLVSVKVPEELMDEVVAFINEHPGVTHNYLRSHEYNLWFTLIVPEKNDVHKILEQLKERFGLEPLDLPMTKRFKIGVKLDI